MRVAVTGASGHVGTNLCRMLIEKGYQVRALIHNDASGLSGLPLELIKGDVLKSNDLIALCKGCETVFNLAACISLRIKDEKCSRINTESCLNLIKAARDEGVKRIIHFSSIHAFIQEPLDQQLNESRQLAIDSSEAYEHSKAVGQKIMTEASHNGPEIIILNPTSIIGPNDFKPSLVGNALIRFYKGKNPCLIPGGYNWVDVRDVCEAAINAVEARRPGECYLLGGCWKDLRTIATEIEKLGGHRAPRIILPFWLASVGAVFLNLHSTITRTVPLYTHVSLMTLKNSHRNISSEKATSELGFKPRPFIETLTETITWYRDNGKI